MASRYPTLSVCMIVKNEEANLPRLLESIKGLADEVILVDTGSTDRTVEVAEAYGAKIYHFDWCEDFSAARNESLAYATKDYILWLDGDDEIETAEHPKIKEHLKRHAGSAAYLKLKNLQPDEVTESIQLRMFPNHRDIRFSGRVHEQVYFSVHEKGIRFTSCDATIVHHGYKESVDIREKLERNRKIHEKELLENPDNPYIYFFLARTMKGLGEFQTALDNYLAFIDRAKNAPEVAGLDIYKIALLESAELFCALQRLGDAFALLEGAKKLFPNFKLFGFSLGQLFVQNGDYEKAYEEFLPLRDCRFDTECLPVNVNGSVLILQRCLGISAMFVHDYKTSIECLSRTVTLEPQKIENYNYLSLAFEKSGDLERAIGVCDQGLHVAGDDSSLKKRRFLLLTKKGDLEQSLAEFDGLNGSSGDLDVLAAMFLIHSLRLDVRGMARYYGLLQDGLALPSESFPEGMDRVKEALRGLKEPQTEAFFESAISHLLSLSA